MIEIIKQRLEEEMVKLPKEKREAISSFNWGDEAEKIGRQFSLSDEEIIKLQVETGLVLAGISDPNLFADRIEANLGIPNEQAKNMFQEIFNKVFSPIADKIEKLIKENLVFKNPSWKQTINFIVSGGNYSSFI